MIGQQRDTIPRQLQSAGSVTLRRCWYPGERHVMLSCLEPWKRSLAANKHVSELH